jgi:predicted ATP-dependent endonuclease of OLD family
MAPGHYSEVLNLSTFQESDEDTKRFLFQYIKLTHCDLFFADAAILVEGNVERLLLPLMISRVSKELKSSYLSILEVGGAFAHKFKNLVHFLGLTTLVITDLDSVQPGIVTDEDEEVVEDIENEPTIKKGRVCPAWKEGAETSNYTLSTWLPGLTKVSELLAADDKKKCPDPTRETPAKIMVAYQTKQEVTWKMEKDSRAGRTFEEAFAYENLEWCQDNKQKALGLRVKQSDNPTLETIAQRIHKKIKGSSFRKTEFALAVMVAESEWLVPIYIADGLRWLKEQVSVINIEK